MSTPIFRRLPAPAIRAVLFAAAALLCLALPGGAAAQICPVSVDGDTVEAAPEDSTGRRGRGRTPPRKRRPPREGRQEVAATSCTIDQTAPVVSISPSQGTFTTPTVNVTVSWSDNVGLDEWAHYVYLNGTDVTSQFIYSGTGTSATSTGTVTLAAGQNTLYAETWDQAGNHGSASASYTYSVPLPAPAPLPAMTNGAQPSLREVVRGIYRAVLEREADPGGLDAWTYNLEHGGWTVKQIVRAFATSQEHYDRFVAARPARAVAATLYRHIYAREGWPEELNYWEPIVANGGWVAMVDGLLGWWGYAEWIGDHAVPGTPVTLWDARRAGLFLEPQSGYADLERDLCLTVAVPGGASECGDLRLAHALPPIRSLNKVRAPVLLYNSQHARPMPVVAARMTLPAERGTPGSVVAVLRVGPNADQLVERARRAWSGSEWPLGQPRRFALSYDAWNDAQGVYAYLVEVTATYADGSTQRWVMRGSLSVVNRRTSVFGAGWWLAGLEQIQCVACGSTKSFLWVGGDGSTRVYDPLAESPSSVWVARTPDRGQDTLWAVTDYPNASYMRRLPGDVRVYFDATGKHIATVNRLGHHTHFGYDSFGRLSSVGVPTAAGYSAFKPEYRFDYGTGSTNGRLYTVTAPDLNGQAARQVVIGPHNGDYRVLSIQDPDLTTVRFEYADAARPEVVSKRTDRLERTGAHYTYGAGGRLVKVNLDMGELVNGIHGEADDLITWLTPAETRGLGEALLAPGDAHAILDGPRTDVVDRTLFWVDRWGSPWKVRDALGHETVVTRSDLRFPALATRMDGPVRANGRQTVSAEYDARGNLLAQTDWSTSRVVNGATVYATTRYEYGDPAWPDFSTKVTLPEGEVSRTGYHPTGSRAWQQPGDDEARRVRFEYGALGLVEWIRLPATAMLPAAAEHLEYDTRGNLRASHTPLGARTVFHNDGLGRTWKTESPINGRDVMTHVVTYDGADRVKTSTTSARMLVGPDSNVVQSVQVENWYDAEGRLRRVSRRSNPDPAQVGWVTTRWEYDAAGRRVAEWAPDATPADSMDNPVDRAFYDPAGNALRIRSRRFRELRQIVAHDTLADTRIRYDALNRVRTHVLPGVRYADTYEGLPTRLHNTGSLRTCAGRHFTQLDHAYPFHPNDGACGYVVAPDSSVFEYDEFGNIVGADNSDAWVRREYNLNGTLRAETQRVRTLAGGPLGQTPHVYEVRYEYDLSGRRVEVHHPGNLAPTASSTNRGRSSYAYDPLTGAMTTVTDVLGNVFTYEYDTRGALERLAQRAPGENAFAVDERYSYDQEGRRETHWVHTPLQGRTIFQQTVTRDVRGKVLSSTHRYGPTQSRRMQYSGLGHLVFHERVSRGTANNCSQHPATYTTTERFGYDGLENLISNFSTTRNDLGCVDDTERTDKASAFGSGTSRLRSAVHNSGQHDVFAYDSAGNTVFSTQHENTHTTSGTVLEDRASYYSADQRLRAADRRFVSDPANLEAGPTYRTSFEEYWYDALGRRVLVRTRRRCAGGQLETECRQEIVRRTVWDGDHELYEIQMPAAHAENDSNPLPNLKWSTNTGWPVDPNPFFGRVAYTHGLAIDQPLSITRIDYADEDPGKLFRPLKPFTIVPMWDQSGQLVTGTFGRGELETKCEQYDGSQRCIRIVWPAMFYAYHREKLSNIAWHGSLLQDKRDHSGTAYRRNRYYDPGTGQFTQEDPIGLAGGLNLYGFAAGDPASYSDPYGLAPLDDIFYNTRGHEIHRVQRDGPDRHFMVIGRTSLRLDGAPIAGDAPYRIIHDAQALDRVAVEWANQAPAPAISTIFWLKKNSGEGGVLDAKPWLAARYGVRTLWNAGGGLYVHNDKVGNAAWGYYVDNRWGLELWVALWGARRQSQSEAGRPEDQLDQAFIRRGYAIPRE